ncbi:FAP25 [Auxenochlorella protothecoides x Auxenochlorella symbiontica]
MIRAAPRTAAWPRSLPSLSAPPRFAHRVSTRAMTFFLDTFAKRQWEDPDHAGSRLTWDQADFVARVERAHAEGAQLRDGYAPFCKHLFIPNFTDAAVGAERLTPDNVQSLRSGYLKRRPEELAVLSRWLPRSAVPPRTAKHLDIILYSREQLVKEHAALPHVSAGDAEKALPDAPWGIISIKAQDEDHETPMQPITILRNALGREEGGSGVPLDKEAYAAAVEYWDAHAIIQ